MGPWLVRGGHSAQLYCPVRNAPAPAVGFSSVPKTPAACMALGRCRVNMDGAASTTPPRDLSDPSSSSILCGTCERMTGRARPVKAQERRFGPAPSRPVY